MKMIFLVLVILFVGTPLAALGQDKDKDITRYRFDDELVSGDLVNPNGEILPVRRKKPSESLIRAREHFVPEMLKSIEKL